MKKLIALGVMLLFLGLTISSTTGVYVEKSSVKPLSFDNILYVGGNGPNNYTKIQDAINDSSNGDTVFVYNGTYYEHNITTDKSINLIGEKRDTTIIYGIKASKLLIIDCNWFNISGFTLKNSECAISLSSGNISISNNNISSNYFGIFNFFNLDWNETDEIFHTFNDSAIIEENIFYNNSLIGIEIIGFDNPIINISRNKFINNNMSCSVATVSNCIIANNVFKNNNEAIAIGMSVNCIIKNNQILNNYFGIIGFFLFGSDIKSNNICNNNIGLDIIGSNNRILQNNFINNNLSARYERFVFFEFLGKFQLFIIPNYFRYCRVISKNKWDGNYWNISRTTPYLIRGELYLFLPFRNPIPLLNIDWNPAKEPYDIGM